MMRGRGSYHLLGLPHVVQDNILSFLTLPEQLTIRRVCKTTKEWVDRSRLRLAEHIPASLVKDDGRNSFKKFLSRRIPHQITHLYVDNSSPAMFETNSSLSDFLYNFSNSITSLRIKRYFICSRNEKQIEFLEALTCLECLEIDEIWIANADEIETRIPVTFRGLAEFKLGQVKVFDETTADVLDNFQNMPLDRKKNLRNLMWSILDICENLRHLRVPISPKSLFDNTFDECFRLLNYIRIRTRGITERGFRAQMYVMQCDLYNFNCCTSSLEVLLIVGSRMRIQFLNVNSKVFKRGSSFCVIGIPPRARFDYIHSFISSSLVNRNFEYIQKLTFKASLIQNECIIGREKGPTLFPNLKEFHILLDIGFDVHWPTAVYSRTVVNEDLPNQPRNVCFPRVDQVLRFFFPENLPYSSVHTASFEFVDPVFPHQKRASPEKLVTLPTIVANLPHVSDLTLKGWNCERNIYLGLWHGFPRLIKLHLDGCSTLTPSCFIAGNGSPNNPANFRFLPDLQYVELRGLDEMPKLMNPACHKVGMVDVFAKLGFTQFDYLTKTDIDPKMMVWIRPNTSAWPSGVSNSTIVTRSVSKAMKCQLKQKDRKKR